MAVPRIAVLARTIAHGPAHGLWPPIPAGC